MGRKDITKYLSDLLEKHLNPSNDTRIYISKEVSFNCYGGEHTIRVDYMRFKPVNNYTAEGIENGKFYCYEIKSSVEDFHSKNGHNFIGDYNYYVMPEEVFENCCHELSDLFELEPVFQPHIAYATQKLLEMTVKI